MSNIRYTNPNAVQDDEGHDHVEPGALIRFIVTLTLALLLVLYALSRAFMNDGECTTTTSVTAVGSCQALCTAPGDNVCDPASNVIFYAIETDVTSVVAIASGLCLPQSLVATAQCTVGTISGGLLYCQTATTTLSGCAVPSGLSPIPSSIGECVGGLLYAPDPMTPSSNNLICLDQEAVVDCPTGACTAYGTCVCRIPVDLTARAVCSVTAGVVFAHPTHAFKRR